MGNKKDDPMGCSFLIFVVVIAILVRIIAAKNGKSSLEAFHLSKLGAGIAGLIYGLIYYTIKKFKK